MSDNIPENEAKRNVIATTYQGPIPPPSLLEQYDQIVPGAAERILAMAEKEGDHRRDMDTKELKENVSIIKSGQYLAGLIILTGIICGAFLIYSDKDISGLAALISSMAAFIGLTYLNKK